jgi:flagellar protein FlgJ
MFIQMMLKSMREAVQKNDPMRSSQQDTFEEMYDRELSMQLAKRNTLGVADMIVKTVERNKSGGAEFKAKAEPMQLKPDAQPMAIEGPKAMPVIRPEKFTIKPRAVTSTGGTGAE